jgi:hypothetical protein
MPAEDAGTYELLRLATWIYNGGKLQTISTIFRNFAYMNSMQTEEGVHITVKSIQIILQTLKTTVCALFTALARCVSNIYYLIYLWFCERFGFFPHNVIAVDM